MQVDKTRDHCHPQATKHAYRHMSHDVGMAVPADMLLASSCRKCSVVRVQNLGFGSLRRALAQAGLQLAAD